MCWPLPLGNHTSSDSALHTPTPVGNCRECEGVPTGHVITYVFSKAEVMALAPQGWAQVHLSRPVAHVGHAPMTWMLNGITTIVIAIAAIRGLKPEQNGSGKQTLTLTVPLLLQPENHLQQTRDPHLTLWKSPSPCMGMSHLGWSKAFFQRRLEVRIPSW